MKKTRWPKLPNLIVPLFECARVYLCTSRNEWLLGVFTGEPHVLAHECAHVAFRICSLCGVEINPDGSNETYCYLLGRIFRFAEGYVKKPADMQPV